MTLEDEDCQLVNERLHKISRDVSILENRYKLRTRWYLTQTLLRKIDPQTSDRCWRCRAEGTLLHIWWSCSCRMPFLAEVYRIMQQVTTCCIEFSPVSLLLLLHITECWSTLKNTTASHMSQSSPTIAEWLKRVDNIAELEELISLSQDKYDRSVKTWAYWLHYKESQEHSSNTYLNPARDRHVLRLGLPTRIQ